MPIYICSFDILTKSFIIVIAVEKFNFQILDSKSPQSKMPGKLKLMYEYINSCYMVV